MLVCVCTCVLFQVLCYLLPATGLQAQDDPGPSGSDAQWLLGHPHIHLLPTHHAKLERHRHRGHSESSATKIRNQGHNNELRDKFLLKNVFQSCINSNIAYSIF